MIKLISGGAAAAATPPLPLIGVYSNYYSGTPASNPECSVLDSNLNLVSRMTQSKFSATNNPIDSEFWAALAGKESTNSQVGSTINTTAWCKATPAIYADGHQFLKLSANGTMSAKNPVTSSAFLTRAGVVLGKKGSRQNISLYGSSTSLAQYSRGGAVLLDTLTVAVSHATASTWGGGTECRGMLGWNDVTKTLVFVEAKDALCNYRAHIWKHNSAKLTGKPGELNKLVLEAKAGANGSSYQYVDFLWNANAATADAESQYRMRVIPCNNGLIAMSRFCVGTGGKVVHMATLNPGTSALDTSFATVASAATVYGHESAEACGMRHQVTWDNKWVICYAQYAQYGSGLIGFAISVDNPAVYFKLSIASSTDGVQMVPCGESGFAYALGDNSDSGVGLKIGVMPLNTGGVNTYGTTTAVGGVIPMATIGGFIDIGYASTNYPMLMPVENW